jgi:hypothetical protein
MRKKEEGRRIIPVNRTACMEILREGPNIMDRN